MSWLKLLHVTAVSLSITGFVLRGVWMIAAPERLQHYWVRKLPHVIDSVLLGSAIALAYQLQQYPLVHGWLTAKVLGLLLYIALGMVALHYGRTRSIRTVAWLAAIADRHG
ncbi:SirB2 family protein [Candidatus Reidiella endopervernicosa]|uniref:SirB2 family protein n=1 Tax=Candidatus Reidiella endopervernicosa TaxID=2738883 RepID=A0A6N0I0A9_9GAMM|nr:SirB2 family protein [Candidatus Reidiella endopervernicosa]QKQ28062.1 SirB2 family protein [Candidatus Reidiella endopervernicosa]